ncbi:hypothetical protein PWP93_02130 [Paraburkholderia sp. A1RI-2L]|uniref:hypothetical protein n=1 Tax=Paraburkholderia sp. A1RI-2L TaxID=3028367 RepID=UPI003B7BEBEC
MSLFEVRAMFDDSSRIDFCRRSAVDVFDLTGARASLDAFRHLAAADARVMTASLGIMESHRQTQAIIKTLTDSQARIQASAGAVTPLYARAVAARPDVSSLVGRAGETWLNAFARWRGRPEIKRVLDVMEQLGVTKVATTRYVNQIARLFDLSRSGAMNGDLMLAYAELWPTDADVPGWVTHSVLRALDAVCLPRRTCTPEEQTRPARRARGQSKDAKLTRIRSDHERGIKIMDPDYVARLAGELGVTPSYVRILRSSYLSSINAITVLSSCVTST